jgi:hypothetical protein
VHVSDDSVIRDTTTETHNLHVSILCVGMSQMRLSHLVKSENLNLTHQDQMKKDTPLSSTTVKMWHDDGV